MNKNVFNDDYQVKELNKGNSGLVKSNKVYLKLVQMYNCFPYFFDRVHECSDYSIVDFFIMC